MTQMTETNLLQLSQKIKPKTRASKRTVIKNQDLEIDQSPKGQGYDTYTPEERKKIMRQFKEKLALFNDQELQYDSDDTCDAVPDWSKDIGKVNPKIFNEWILQIISQYRPRLNLKDTKTLTNFRRKIKGWFEKEGSPDNRGGRLIPQSEEDEMSSFKESLMKAIEAMKVRDFPYLQALMRPMISKIRSRNKKQDAKNMFSTKYWSTFINKPENQDIKRKWESLPLKYKKDLGNREDERDDYTAILTRLSLEEVKNFKQEEDAKFLKNFCKAPTRNVFIEDNHKRELAEIKHYQAAIENQTKINQIMPNENQFGDFNDEPQNENDEDQIAKSKNHYWVKETGFGFSLPKTKWESLPHKYQKDLGNREDERDDYTAILARLSLEEVKNFKKEEDAKFLKNFCKAPTRNVFIEDNHKRELAEVKHYQASFKNQTKINQVMPNENQFDDFNDEPQNENEEDQITESNVDHYWVKETGFSLREFEDKQVTAFDIKPQFEVMAHTYLRDQSFGEYDFIPRSPVPWNGQEENLEQDICQEGFEEGMNEGDFCFFRCVKYYGSYNEKQLADPKAMQSHSTGIYSSHKGVPGGIFDSVYQKAARGYALPMGE